MNLFHYTKFENLTNIIRNEVDEHGETRNYLSFLLTYYGDFDDPLEGKPCRNLLKKIYGNDIKQDIWSSYILSLCKEPDVLPLWKEYANDATGLVLELDTDVFTFGKLKKCIYDPEEKKHISDIILNKLVLCQEKHNHAISRYYKAVSISHNLHELSNESTLRSSERSEALSIVEPAICFKDEHYDYEEETRLICSGHTSMFERFKGIRNYILVDRLLIEEPIESLKGIYIGPRLGKSAENTVNEYLKLIGLSEIPVKRTGLHM